MRLQLLKLILWPKDPQHAPRVVEFKPGVLNVLTGASRTGKSAVIPIIDYCLASSECFIPIETIRDYVAWYGVIFDIGSEQVMLARAVPDGTRASNKFYLERAPHIAVPPFIPAPNETMKGVKGILNTLAYVPSFSLDGDEGLAPYQSRLGFRDLMALVFQNQDIVANQSILFYKTHAHEHRERLRNWFPFILGAEDIGVLEARHRLLDVDKLIRQLSKEFDAARFHSTTWVSNMAGHLRVAKEYGLLDHSDGDKIDEMDSERMLAKAREIVENAPDYSRSQADNVLDASEELTELEAEEDQISSSIGDVKKRLVELRKLKSGFSDYGNAVRKRVERLHLSEWLKDVSNGIQACPICGSSEHPKGVGEIEKISTAFRKYERESKKLEEIPTSFSREELRLERKLAGLVESHQVLQSRYDTLLGRSKTAQEEFQRRKSLYIFLGHLKASLETFESLGDGSELRTNLENLEREHNRLLTLTDPNGVQRRVDAATLKISQGILRHLLTLDVEEKYREVAPRFDVKNLGISVLSTDGNWHFLAEVGSASNWVSFHVALFCALQEFFSDQEVSCVPSFVVFDQPSQVYFPKVRRSSEFDDFDTEYKDEDADAVTKIFRTVAESIKSKKGAWQAIILDHADSSIYGEIEGIYEVEVWRDGNKLVPEAWYS